MADIAALIERHGPLLVSAVCFTEAIGLPVPAAIALLGAGALSHQGRVDAAFAYAAGLGGLLTADMILYSVGRFSGWYFLGLLCRLSANPESCIYNSAHAFYKRGRKALLVTKFIPGINTMAAPLAGSLGMRFPQFLAFDAAGALFYSGVYFGLGYVFSDLLGVIVSRVEDAGRVTQMLLIVLVVAYLGYRAVVAWRLRATFLDIPRVSPGSVARELEDSGEAAVVFDVRSHGYYGDGVVRIRGAQRLEPNRLAEAMHEMPEGKKIYLYCT